MNLSEATAFVLKNKGQKIIQEFWKEDLVRVVSEVISDGTKLFREGRKNLSGVSFRDLPGSMLNSGLEVIEIARVMPGRIKKALNFFEREFLIELEKREEVKEKALFCFRVLGVLSATTLSTVYSFRGPGRDLSLGKMKVRTAMAQFIMAELALRSLRLFVRRFLRELEKEITEKADLEHVQYFQRLLDERGEIPQENLSENDPAFRITDKFRRMIVNGDDES